VNSERKHSNNESLITVDNSRSVSHESQFTTHDIAISIKNLSKSYKMYPSPAEMIKELLHPFKKRYHRDFWALKNVSFELKKGESIGIIGRNGSGKSTLLQVLCGILKPTEGEVSVKGKISALLDLGAGFNPNFTGRENVYMNGAISGFTKKEMDERFQAIADFADIGDFIEQPVKTYSSGMNVRLAFACAVHVDPDILIIDEVLAVGDFKFRQKCSQKINEIRKNATVVLVSHTMRDILMLCSKATVLDKGRVVFQGTSEEAVGFYMEMMVEKKAEKKERVKPATEVSKDTKKTEAAPGEGTKKTEEKENLKPVIAARKDKKNLEAALYGDMYHNKEKITDVRHQWVDESGNAIESIKYGTPIALEFSFKLLKPVKNLIIGVPVWDHKGHYITGISTDMDRKKIEVSLGGVVKGRLAIDKMIFNSGTYTAVLAVHDDREYLYRGLIDKFRVKDMPLYFGMVTPEHQWQFEKSAIV